MTVIWLRTPISHIWSYRRPNSHTSKFRVVPHKSWSAKDWVLVTLAEILAIAGLESDALRLGIDGTALRASLTSIGVLRGAGFGQVLR